MFKLPDNFKDTMSTIQSLMVSAGILVGGVMFFLRGDGRPHLNIVQQAEVIEIKGSGYMMVALAITIANIGEMPVTRTKGYVSVLGMLPLKADFAEALKKGKPPGKNGQVDWNAVIAPLDLPSPLVLEAGEEQLIHLDFFVPNSITHLRSDVELPPENERSESKSAPLGVGWTHTKIIHLAAPATETQDAKP